MWGFALQGPGFTSRQSKKSAYRDCPAEDPNVCAGDPCFLTTMEIGTIIYCLFCRSLVEHTDSCEPSTGSGGVD